MFRTYNWQKLKLIFTLFYYSAMYWEMMGLLPTEKYKAVVGGGEKAPETLSKKYDFWREHLAVSVQFIWQCSWNVGIYFMISDLLFPTTNPKPKYLKFAFKYDKEKR